MENHIGKIERIILQHGSYVKTVGEEISEGISLGVKEGVSDGLKRGVKDALQECLTKGFVNVGEDDIPAILEGVPQEFVKNTVKEGVRVVFKESIEDHINGLCQELVNSIRKKEVEIKKDQTEHIVNLIKGIEQEAMDSIAQKLPNNAFLREVVSGIQTALEDNIDNYLRECEVKILKEIDIA